MENKIHNYKKIYSQTIIGGENIKKIKLNDSIGSEFFEQEEQSVYEKIKEHQINNLPPKIISDFHKNFYNTIGNLGGKFNRHITSGSSSISLTRNGKEFYFIIYRIH
jgi:hypothetical protein